jgi:hypothetical protein
VAVKSGHLGRLGVVIAVLLIAGVVAGWLAWRTTSGGPDLGSDGWSVERALPSPDGRHVAFLGTPRKGDVLRPRLVLAGRDSKSLGPARAVALSFGWMPDSGSLLLAYSDEMGGENPIHFVVVALDGTEIRRIEPNRQGTATDGISVSPDGGSAVFPAGALSRFVGPTQLWRVDLASGDVTELAVNGDPLDNQSDPSFSDAEQLVMASGRAISSTQGPNGWVGKVDLRAGTTTRLTPAGQTVDTPTIAPGGRYVVYDAFPGNERSKRALWVVPVDGSAPPRELMDADGLRPAIEPDGKSILLVDGGSPVEASRIVRVAVPSDAPWLSGR